MITPQRENLSIIIKGFADSMNRGMTSKGDLAEFLRTGNIDYTHSSLREIIKKNIPENAIRESTDETNSKSWEVILKGMARMFPFHHDKNISLGGALGNSGFSEARVTKLLRSSGYAFFECVRRVSVFLASNGQRVNWTEFAALILSSNPEQKTEIREKIAVDYYKFTGLEDNRSE